VWDVTVFTKNRNRLLKGEVAEAFFTAVLAQARQRDLLSDEHFTVDGTLIEAWAGQKSFKRKDQSETKSPPDDPGNPSVDFHGEQRRNDTHQSTTDPQARLARKGAGKEAKLSYAGHVLMENRHGLVVNCCITQASGRAEAEAAVAMVEGIPGWLLAACRDDERRQIAGHSQTPSPTNHRNRKSLTKVTTAKSWFRNCASIKSLRISRSSKPLLSTSVLPGIRATR